MCINFNYYLLCICYVFLHAFTRIVAFFFYCTCFKKKYITLCQKIIIISPFALCAVYSRARSIRRARTIRGNTVVKLHYNNYYNLHPVSSLEPEVDVVVSLLLAKPKFS